MPKRDIKEMIHLDDTSSSQIDSLFDLETLKKCVVDHCDSNGLAYIVSQENRGKVDESRPKVHHVSYQLPMTFPFKGDTFYIRECFPVYYDVIIMASFASGWFDLLSVTGPPGNGKSVFYIYLFERYRAQHPDQTIVTASWTMNHVLLECIVFVLGKSQNFIKIQYRPLMGRCTCTTGQLPSILSGVEWFASRVQTTRGSVQLGSIVSTLNSISQPGVSVSFKRPTSPVKLEYPTIYFAIDMSFSAALEGTA